MQIFQEFPIALKGTKTAEEIYQSVGKALTHWEILEDSMAVLFNKLSRPQSLSSVSQRIYLSETAPSSRRKLIKTAASAYFEFFENRELELKTNEIIKIYESGSNRRNEIAHGFVAGHINPNKEGFSGYYLGPHFNSIRKRDRKFRPKYLITNNEIEIFVNDSNSIRGQVNEIQYEIVENWRKSPEARRERY